ncbi:MAG: glutamine synthetase family protein [Lachnospiraceae bacterium]|nr:glutamine synthetase family protein [Lachnospiraceae bacterium]
MNYTQQEVMQFVEEEDVKFIRLTFCDVFGKQKNLSIMPSELPRAFAEGIPIDAWAVEGFDRYDRSDIFLHPDPGTLAILPWRPEHGRVVRMFCDITWPDGTPFPCDTRRFLKEAQKAAEEAGFTFRFGTEQEFYLFDNDMEGGRTDTPYDNAAYMDIGPEDRGENIRREICMTLEQMGINPESSHHEEGPGQNEIDFRYTEPLKAADDAMTFRSVVSAIASRNGVRADFSPKPIPGAPGNGMHINFSVSGSAPDADEEEVTAGILNRAKEMTLFLNPVKGSYERLGSRKAPAYVCWGYENRSALIRIPAAFGEQRRGELRSPDTTTNPYIALGLLIYAGLEGLKNHAKAPDPITVNLYRSENADGLGLEKLPGSYEEAAQLASESAFIGGCLPEDILKVYLDKGKE